MKKFEHGGVTNNTQIKLDFSANINPFGIPESVKKAVADGIDSFSAYPDINCTALTKKIAAHEKITAKNIVCGNGAADLIYRIVYAVKPHTALLVSPTFLEYEKALTEVNCNIDFYCLDEKNNFVIDEKILNHLTSAVDILFLCNPNNPVGNLIDTMLLAKIISKCSEENILLVVDECFMDFVADSENYSIKKYLNDKIIILKAFTKTYSMAGLRLGYALFGNETLADKVRHTGQCWSVSTPAQLAGIAALDETKYLEKSAALVNREREFMALSLKKIGFKIYPSVTNFLLLKSDIPLEKKLAEQGIALRSCDNYEELDERFYRTAIRLHSENEALINALERIVKNG